MALAGPPRNHENGAAPKTMFTPVPGRRRSQHPMCSWGSSASQTPYLLHDGLGGRNLVEHRIGSSLHDLLELHRRYGRAQHHNRDACIRLAQLADQLPPVSVGQGKVDYRNVKGSVEHLSGLG